MNIFYLSRFCRYDLENELSDSLDRGHRTSWQRFCVNENRIKWIVALFCSQMALLKYSIVVMIIRLRIIIEWWYNWAWLLNACCAFWVVHFRLFCHRQRRHTHTHTFYQKIVLWKRLFCTLIFRCKNFVIVFKISESHSARLFGGEFLVPMCSIAKLKRKPQLSCVHCFETDVGR